MADGIRASPRGESDEFQHLIGAVVDYAVFRLDAGGQVASWNAGAERIEGYAAGKIVGLHFSVFFTREDRAARLPERLIERAARTGRAEAEGWRIRADASRFWAQSTLSALHAADGGLAGFVAVTRDITERRAAQQALADSERQLRLLIGGVDDYALYMLDPNGVITSWNAGAKRITGYSADEMIGQHFSRFYTEADRAAALPMRALNLAAETGAYAAEGWRRRKDGSLFWAKVSVDAIHEDGQPAGFAKITRDVTEQREAAVALEHAREQLAQSQKMEALGQLTGGVANDFNNLLMIIGGHAQLLKKAAAADPRGAGAIEAIETAVVRGASLTRQLLSFAGRQQLQRARIDLASRIEAFCQMIAGSLGARVRLTTELPQELWPVEADVNELELALVNIGVNARDAMPDGGVLAVAAQNVSFAGADAETGLQGEFVAVTLTDTGIGIADDILPRVFDPFFTTKEAEKGTGLGLSQVYGFARRVGGAVKVRSKVGEGAAVTLYLPRAHAAAKGAGEPAAAEAAGLTGSILVVEDNPEVAKVSAALLAELGHRPVVAHSPAAALAALEQDGGFDLVFSDIVMAGPIDGADLARLIRERHPGLPVLLTSGYSRAAESAGDEFAILRKPYQITELGRSVAKFLAEARGAADPDKLVRLSEARQAREAQARDAQAREARRPADRAD